MERVQFEQEQMLAELKDFGEKGIFSSPEIKQIIKKRTAFETALVRRIPNKNDYLRYAAYEMGLEALRRKRVARLKLPKTPPSISDYALTRRQFQIFERALQKFKSDVSLWQQYLRVAQRAGARALAGRVAARAVQLHPRTPVLYVLAAAHELAHGGMGAARALLLRGLRLNAGCAELWREYVKLEMGFVEAVRRRWDVLGISLNEDDGDDDDDDGQGGRIDRAEEEAMGDAARRKIMGGAIVRQAIDGAAKALPTIELFRNLQTLITGYPAPEALRSSLLDHLHMRLSEALPRDAAALKLRATRSLVLASPEELAGGALVDALRGTNEEMLATLDADTAERCMHDELAEAYAQFIEEWCGKEEVDAHLKLYLVGSLHALIKRQDKKAPSVALLGTHVRLLVALADLPSPPAPPSRILSIARRYTSISPTNTSVWLARLHAESAHGTSDSMAEAWTSARRAVPTCSDIWLWGADRCCPKPSPYSSLASSSWAEFDALLAESMQDAALRGVHESLLIRIAESIGGELISTAERRSRVAHVAKRCLPTSRVWARMFEGLTTAPCEEEDEGLVREVYECWRGTGEVEEATVAWAKWLLCCKGRGDEAMKVIERARGGAGQGGAALTERWATIVRRRDEAEPEGRAIDSGLGNGNDGRGRMRAGKLGISENT